MGNQPSPQQATQPLHNTNKMSQKEDILFQLLLHQLLNETTKDDDDEKEEEEEESLNEPSSHKAIIAIDFGTSGTGAAFVDLTADKQDPKAVPLYNANVVDKVPTAILLKENGEFEGFGDGLENVQETNKLDSITTLFFDRFKMHLFNLERPEENSDTVVQVDIEAKKIKNLDKVLLAHSKKTKTLWAKIGDVLEPIVVTDDHRFMPVKVIITKALHYICERALEALKNSSLSMANCSYNDIKWVITVPAIWTEAAKGIMTEVTRTAIGVNANVEIVLEPEAGAATCFSSYGNQLKNGERYIVLDCGGGTIDICVQEIQQQGVGYPKTLKSLTAPCGGDWGSTYIDDRFVRFLCDELFPKAKLEEKHLGIVKKMRNAWIIYKNTMINDKISELILDLEELSKNKLFTAAELKKTLEQEKLKTIKYSDKMNKLRIPKAFLETFIDDSVTKTVEEMTKIMSQVDRIEYVFLIGGLSTNPLFRRTLEDKFLKTGKVKAVVNPNQPIFAVAYGACLLGMNSGLINCRVIGRWIGVKVHNPFNPEIHDPKYVDASKDEKLVPEFSVIIKKGESIAFDQIIQKQYSPMHPLQRAARVEIYSSTSEVQPKYATQQDVKLEASLEIKFGKTKNFLETLGRSVAVEIQFGGSAMKVATVDSVTKKRKAMKIKFL